MKKYNQQKKLEQVICNKCGRAMSIHNGIMKEDFFHGMKAWGYFSDKDGRNDYWDLCERCYDEMTGGFLIPPKSSVRPELMDE